MRGKGIVVVTSMMRRLGMGAVGVLVGVGEEEERDRGGGSVLSKFGIWAGEMACCGMSSAYRLAHNSAVRALFARQGNHITAGSWFPIALNVNAFASNQVRTSINGPCILKYQER